MKTILKQLWFSLFIKKGQLVSAKTVPLVMADVILGHSIEVIGTYTDIHKTPGLCYIKGLDGASYQVYVKSVKKVSTTKNPELFI